MILSDVVGFVSNDSYRSTNSGQEHDCRRNFDGTAPCHGGLGLSDPFGKRYIAQAPMSGYDPDGSMGLDYNRHDVVTLVLTAASYAFFLAFPIAQFPEEFSKSVKLFQLAKEHKQITYSQYSRFTQLSSLILPIMAVTVAVQRHKFLRYLVVATSWLIFWFVLPQSHSFGTDAPPLDFETEATWSVYIAIYLPLIVRIYADTPTLRHHFRKHVPSLKSVKDECRASMRL